MNNVVSGTITTRPRDVVIAPRPVIVDMADFEPVTEKFGNLTAICPDCGSIIYQRFSMAKLGQVQGKLTITFPQALERLSESSKPTLNSDLR